MQTLIADVVDITKNLNENAANGPVVQTDLGTIIGSFVGVAILIGGIATFGYLILGGVRWVLSGGDKGKIEKAQQTIVQSIIGLAVVVSIYALFGVVQYFFGFSILGGGSLSQSLGSVVQQQVQRTTNNGGYSSTTVPPGAASGARRAGTILNLNP